ncbi:MAG: deoxycytidylate deaminase [Thaumarchaeota archaeon]|nr:deoxycytidylate deaminase [Nitrososphaerota archaeon]
MCAGFERPSWDEYFMLQAELAKLRSNCITRQVGAVIVRNNRQIATQLRMEGKIESGAALDRCLCSHAEANAIMHCAIMGIEAGTKDATLYTTFVPCLECSKMAITIGVKRIVCLDTYPETDYDLMNEAGIEIIKLDKKNIQRWAGTLLDEPKK